MTTACLYIKWKCGKLLIFDTRFYVRQIVRKLNYSYKKTFPFCWQRLFAVGFAMSDKCFTCSCAVTRRTPSLTCSVCKQTYHNKCLNIPEDRNLEGFPGATWSCIDCKTKIDGDSPLNAILSKLNIMSKNMDEIKSQQIEFSKAIQFYGAKIDDFNGLITKFEEKINKIPNLEKDVHTIAKDVNTLQAEVDALQQHSRRNNLEIRGVPEAEKENIKVIFSNIVKYLNLDNSTNLYDVGHRIPRFNRNSTAPRAIIIRVASRTFKEEIISAIRLKKGMKASNIGFPATENDSEIYINDHLTHKNKLLYKKVRDACKRDKLKCWTRDCKIYYRNHDGKSVFVRSEEDIRSLSRE